MFNRKLSSNELLDYLAGFFDGDGCFTILKRKGRNVPIYCVSVEVGSVDERLPRIFKRVFGGSLRIEKRKFPKKNLYKWYGSNGVAERLIHAFHGRLTVKRVSADLCVELQKTRKAYGRRNRISHVEISRREKIRMALRKANSKGQKNVGSSSFSIAYLSGFFDAEGCVQIRKSFSRGKYLSYQSAVTVVNRCKWILDVHKKRFGGSVHSQRNGRIYYWQAQANLAHRFICKISRFLIIKKTQVGEAARFRKFIGPVCVRRSLSSTIAMENCYQIMRGFNRRGRLKGEV